MSGDAGHPRWLFPGFSATGHLNAATLSKRLKVQASLPDQHETSLPKRATRQPHSINPSADRSLRKGRMGKGKRLREQRAAVAEPAGILHADIRGAPVTTAAELPAVDKLFRSRIFDDESTGRPIVVRPEQLARLLLRSGISREEYDQALLVAHNRSGTLAGAIDSHLPLAFLAMASGEVAAQIKREMRLLERLAVAPAFERQGVGEHLVEEAAHQHAAAGATQWVAGVNEKHKSALPFYRRMGFQVFNRFTELPFPMRAIPLPKGADYDTFWIHRRF